MDLSTVGIILQVIFLEGILSIDNAAVLGAMVSVLPTREPVPWPGPLKFLGPPVHRILGGQQGAALKVGLIGAYLGRGIMLVLASFVIHNAFLKFLGAIYLVKLAFENLGAPEPGETDEHGRNLEGKGFWSVVLAVELADLAFSLDNVVAVIALSDNLVIVMLGVALGIITMRFAAGIFTWMIAKEPLLKPAAYMVVFNIGAELLAAEFLDIHVDANLKFAISAGTLIAFIIYARVKPLHILRPIFIWVAQGMSNLNELLDWALVPLVTVLKVVFKALFFVLKPLGGLLPAHDHAAHEEAMKAAGWSGPEATVVGPTSEIDEP